MPEATPDQLDAEQPDPFLAAGKALFAKPWDFLTAAVGTDHLPPADKLEIAFAGRSNVGKSSLINALVAQNGLARTSNTPGRTQQLNFFEAETSALRLVDMPGYGFAKAPKDAVDGWQRLVRRYLFGRSSLGRVYVLIDSRHGLKKIDKETLEAFDAAAVSYQVVLTKADKIKPPAVKRVTDETLKALVRNPAAYPEVIATSSETGLGIDQVRASMARLMSERAV